MANTRLSLCPFCGGQAIFEQIKGAVGDEIRWSVGCRTDICIAFQMMANYPRKSDAAAAWNKRPASAPETRTALDYSDVPDSAHELLNGEG